MAGFRGIYSGGSWMLHRSHRDNPYMVFSPTSRLRLAMDLLSVIVLAYDVLSLPYMLAFEVPQEGTVMTLSMISVCFWTADLILCFRTAFWRKGRLEMSPRRIAIQYLRNTFMLDASLVLLDLLAIVMILLENNQPKEMDAFKLWRIGKITRIMRCLSFLRLRSVADIVERVSQRSKFLQATSLVVYDVIRIVFVILWLNHIIACLWVALGKNVSNDTGMSWLDVSTGGHDGMPYGYAANKLGPAGHGFALGSDADDARLNAGLPGEFLGAHLQLRLSSVWRPRVLDLDLLDLLIRDPIQDRDCKQHPQAGAAEPLPEEGRHQPSARHSGPQARAGKDEVPDAAGEQRRGGAPTAPPLPASATGAGAVPPAPGPEPLLLSSTVADFVLAVDDTTAEELCHNCAEFSVLGKSDTLFLAGVGAEGIFFVTSGALGYTPGGANRLMKARGQSRLMPTGSTEEVSLPTNYLQGVAQLGAGGAGPVAVRGGAVVRVAARGDLRGGPGALLRGLARGGAAPDGADEVAQGRRRPVVLGLRAQLPRPAERGHERPHGQRWSAHRPAPAVHLGRGHLQPARGGQDSTFVGQVALRELRRSLGSARGLGQGWVASLGEGSWPDVDALREDVGRGASALVLSRASRFGVKRVITMVALQLCREDGRVLVALRRPDSRVGDGGGAEAKLPGLRQEDGEFPEQCYRRLVDDYFGAMAPGIVLKGTERQSDERTNDDLGVSTKLIKVVFKARWEPPPTVAEGALGRRGSVTSELSPPVLLGTAGAQKDLLQTNEVFHLPGGLLVAWFTPEELQKCAAADGTKALGQWLSRVTFPLRKSKRRRSRRLHTLESIVTNLSADEDSARRLSSVSVDEESLTL
ncbi:unnamed protein product [Prorocentrum cordatum]|uniref:Ion transport domain-containing protein n=1 Tax=Prorocentrum cordatum TaxID=2364126 RepID=A0ABN9V8F6_9DINO|nr:unnamed protein product [Polarella glacialis]